MAVRNMVYDVVYDNLAYCANDVRNLLDTVQCKRYIQISSAAVYEELHENTREEEFHAESKIISYIKLKTAKSPVLKEDGDAAPYNGMKDYYLNTDKAKAQGFQFTPLSDWIYDLIDALLAI